MPARRPSRPLVAVGLTVGLALGPGLTACSSGGSAPPSGGTTVTATDTACRASVAVLTAGRHTFSVSNRGSTVTEVYVYGAGDRIVGEVENIGPGTGRELTVDLPAGRYELACKPGGHGTGIRTALTVSGGATSGAAATPDAAASRAVDTYRGYVEREAAALLTATGSFAAAVRAGDVAGAQRLYAPARLHWERIEPVAESFGDLDPRIDMRADDVTGGAAFTGFHRLEQDLWQRHDLRGSAATADRLVADVHTLVGRIPHADISALTIANGAKSLLDEVAKSKVTGEEERYSRVDLVDFLGNVEGSQQAVTALTPLVSDRALLTTLRARFATLLGLLATHRTGAAETDVVPYDRLGAAQVRALAVAVDDVSEPLGQLAAAVTTR